MQGNSQIIDRLNRLLTAELTAIDVYFLQSRMFQDWGYEKLYARFDHEKQDEEGHAAQLIERILFLEGTPNVQDRLGFAVETDVKKMLEMDLALELDVARNLNEAIALCDEVNDAATREMLEILLADTENDHIFWLESQLHIIEQVGLANYLAEQMEAPA